MKKTIIALLVFFVGCAPWVQVGGPYKASSLNCSFELPDGWMRINTSKHILLTRDGVLLQNIFIKRVEVDEPLEHTKKKLRKEMLPQELSEVILDNIASDQSFLNLEILEKTPVEISGRPGFRAVFNHKNSDSLRLKTVYYGFLQNKWFYSITYTAAVRHYFDKDVEAFEKVVKSFKLIKTS